MKLPGFKRLDRQNFEEKYKDLIETLSFTLNNDVEVLYEVLNRKASLRDNFLCVVKDVRVVVDSNGIPKNTASFQIDIQNMKVLGCEVINALNQVNSATYPISAPFINFAQSSNIVNITHVTGLQANQEYVLTIISWGA